MLLLEQLQLDFEIRNRLSFPQRGNDGALESKARELLRRHGAVPK